MLCSTIAPSSRLSAQHRQHRAAVEDVAMGLAMAAVHEAAAAAAQTAARAWVRRVGGCFVVVLALATSS